MPPCNWNISAGRHPVLRGFEETNLISFGGVLEPLRLDASAQVLLTFVPPFPVYPPESVWMFASNCASLSPIRWLETSTVLPRNALPVAT